MKKFIAYMALALIVYLLIYAALIGFKRMSASNIRDFCERLEIGQPLVEVEALVKNNGFSSALNPLPDDRGVMIFINSPKNQEATCQGILKQNKLTQKKFVLSVF